VSQFVKIRDDHPLYAFTCWLERPLATRWCVVGWIGASSIFFGLIRLVGGPSHADSSGSIYSTWAIAHGDFSCAYPPANAYHFPLTAPLYPLLSGGIAALLRIGHSVGFPSQSDLGPHCINALSAISRWSGQSHADEPTAALGYLSWLVLVAGIVALLRTSGRGRRGWEPTILVLIVLTTPVFTALGVFFHPQDILALGLALWGVACVRRGFWGWAGVLLGLAFSSQQFAILALVPLAVVAPRKQLLKFVGLVVGAVTVLDAPLVLMTSGRAFTAAVVGSGWVDPRGGTILDEVVRSKSIVVLLSRLLPIGCSAALAWWAKRRLGSRVFEPVPLISLIATSFCFRLVFEVNLWGYYLMATAVTLVILDASIGRIRGALVCWLVLVGWAFSPVLWAAPVSGMAAQVEIYRILPIVSIGVAFLLIVLDALRHRIRLYLFIFVLLLVGARAHEGWNSIPTGPPSSVWYWQIVLVPMAIVWAVRPLIELVKKENRFGFALSNDE
jgi:hypothetical protein